MCTAFRLVNDSLYFGRNMDLEVSFGESVVITPREYPITTRFCGTLSSHYAMIGMANVTNGYPLYAEAANEKGICMAGLNFPGNAWYLPESEVTKQAVTPFELIPFLLGTCETLAEVRQRLSGIELVDVPFLPTMPLAPLHWIISDKTGSLTLECTRSGMQVYENPYDVLTNNPPFPFHCENVRQYLHLSAGYPENRFSGELSLSPFGQGAGAIGLPGDFSPASRFVKAVFCKSNSRCAPTEEACVSQVFHILDSVAMVRGSVITPEGKEDITTYSCCINATEGSYFYKTYENNQLTKVPLTAERRQGKELLIFPLRTRQAIAVE